MRVLIPGALRTYTGAAEIDLELESERVSLDAMFDALDQRYPGLRFRVVDEQQRLRPNMRVFVNGLGVRALDHELKDEDFVAVVLALSGG